MKKLISTFAAIAAVALLASCGSTDAAPAEPAAPAQPQPARATEIPTFTFTGNELKIQVEEMLYEEFLVFADPKAENGWAAKLLNDTSWAECQVTFPAGSYVGLVNEDAPDGTQDAFNVSIDGVFYRTFPSDPPIGTYELTTRTPMNFSFDTEKTVTVRIQQNDPNRPNKPGENGMKLDYIVFTKK